MIKPKVGIKLLSIINYLMPESLVFSCAKILFLASLLSVAVKDRSPLTLITLVCLLFYSILV